MINFERTNIEEKVKAAYEKIKGLRRRTKELICVGMTVMMLGSFIIYDAAAAYAAGDMVGTPHSLVVNGTEIAVLQSKGDAEAVLANIKESYGKTDDSITAFISPAVKIEEKQYVTAENVQLQTVQQATDEILKDNNDGTPLFNVTVTSSVVTTKDIAYKTKVVKDKSLKKGKKKVVRAGVTGKKIVLGQQTLVNGKVTEETVYSEEVTAKPVAKVVKKGTKVVKKKTETTSNSNSSTSSSNSGSSNSGASYNASTSSGIVGYAQSFTGVPYVYGGATPAGFDCSGFTMYVFGAFGVSLPHSSGAQAGYGVPVSYSEARPGDLVVMPGHVGIYAGNGMIVHAPAPGQSVKTQAIWQGCSFRRLV